MGDGESEAIDSVLGGSGGGDSGRGSYSLRFFGGCSAVAMASSDSQSSRFGLSFCMFFSGAEGFKADVDALDKERRRRTEIKQILESQL